MKLTVGKKMAPITTLFTMVAIIPFLILGVMVVPTARDLFILDNLDRLTSIKGVKKSPGEGIFGPAAKG